MLTSVWKQYPGLPSKTVRTDQRCELWFTFIQSLHVIQETGCLDRVWQERERKKNNWRKRGAVLNSTAAKGLSRDLNLCKCSQLIVDMLSTMVSRNLSPVSIHTDVKLSLTRQPRDQGVVRGEGEERRAEQVRNHEVTLGQLSSILFLVTRIILSCSHTNPCCSFKIDSRCSAWREPRSSHPLLSPSHTAWFPLLYSPPAALCIVRR